MNFVEFKQKVNDMEKELKEKDIDPVDAKIGYTRATGEHIIVAIVSDSEYTVASYFKW